MRTRWVAVLGATLVALVAVGCADAKTVGPSAPAAPEIGRLWQLAHIGHTGTVIAVPSSVRATLQLTADGSYLASDGVNTISGRYRTTDAGVVLTSSLGTAVGYAGHDPVRLGAIAAMQAVTSGAPVTVQVVHPTMTMTVAGYTLGFTDVGAAVVYPSPYGTPTAVSRTS